MNTTEQEHHKMVHELVKDPSTIVTDPRKIDLNHMALGVMGEIGEIAEWTINESSIEFLWEEMGDLEFYMCHLRSLLNIPYSNNFAIRGPFVHIKSKALNLVVAGGNLVDVIKKHTIYGQDLHLIQLEKCIHLIDWEMKSIYYGYGQKRETVLQMNINKLRKRYPVGYSDAAAKMRADKLEDINLQQDADYRKMREENSVTEKP